MKQQNSFEENGDNSPNSFNSHAFDDAYWLDAMKAISLLGPTRTSVDTIHFTGPFEIVGPLPTKVVIQQFSRDGERRVHLYTDSEGVAVYGVRAKLNNGRIFVSIEPEHKYSPLILCKVSFSVPRVLYGTNEEVPHALECEAAIERIEQTLSAWGIEMNVREAKPTRIDVLRHLEMNRPAICHVNVLHYLTIGHSTHTKNYPTGIVRGNESTQLCAYCKGAEMTANNRPPSQIKARNRDHQELLDKLDNGTILRVEWRLRNSPLIRRELGISTISDLLDKFDELDDWLSNKLNKHLFREETPFYVEPLIGKSPEDRPTAKERGMFLAGAIGGTSAANKQVLLFEALEQRMRVWEEECMPELRKMHDGPRGSAEFSKLQAELRKTMLWALSVDGIPNAVLYEELRRAANAFPGLDWSRPRRRRGASSQSEPRQLLPRHLRQR